MSNTITMLKLQYPATRAMRARANIDVKALKDAIAGMVAMASIRRDKEILQVPEAWKVNLRVRQREVAAGVPLEDQEYDYMEGLQDAAAAYYRDLVYGSKRDPSNGGSGSIPYAHGRERPATWLAKWIIEEEIEDSDGKTHWVPLSIRYIPPRQQSTVERKNPRRTAQQAAELSTPVGKAKRRRASLSSGGQPTKKRKTSSVMGKDSSGNTVNIKKNRGLSQRQKIVVPPSDRQLRALDRLGSCHRTAKTINDVGDA